MRLRLAVESDIPALRELIELSVSVLQAGDYSAEQRAGALGTVFGVDTQLIADGTYFAVESGDGRLAGCGGWSKRKTLFGSDEAGPRREPELLDPRVDAAKIRAFFVHPEFARRGVGSLILQASESAAMQAGFGGFELGATLTGERLYRARGYEPFDQLDVPLANGTVLPVIRMRKRVC